MNQLNHSESVVKLTHEDWVLELMRTSGNKIMSATGDMMMLFTLEYDAHHKDNFKKRFKQLAFVSLNFDDYNKVMSGNVEVLYHKVKVPLVNALKYRLEVLKEHGHA